MSIGASHSYRNLIGSEKIPSLPETSSDQNPVSAPEEEDEEIVYVTPTGRVYHRERNCTYLLPRVRALPAGELNRERNESGGRYYACETCRPGKSGTVYVTEYGNRYHSSRNCSTISRTVKEVKLSAVVGRMPPCSKCGY